MHIINNKFKKDKYIFIKYYNSGIVLKGWEVRSIKSKNNIQIKNSIILIKNEEIFLIKSFFTPLEKNKNYIIDRERKLLLNKNEILEISNIIYKNKYLIIPLSIFLKDNLIKLKISIVSKNNIKKKLIKNE